MKKIVMRINVKGNSCRSKALMLASSMNGVESVGIRGKDRNYLVVTGNGVDPVDLARALRKKMGYAEIIGVGRTSAEESVERDEEPKCESMLQQHTTDGEVQSSQGRSIAYSYGFPPGYPCLACSSSCNYPAQYGEVCYCSGHGDGCSIM